MNCPQGWPEIALSDVVRNRSGNGKLIKGKLSSTPEPGYWPAFSASGQDVWNASWEHEGPAVIVSAVGARCGKCFRADGKWSAIANTHVLLPDTSKIDRDFLWYRVNDEKYWIRSGTAQPFVKVRDSLDRKTCLPPVDQQRRIVATLDSYFSRLDEVETGLERVQRNLKRYRASVLQAAVTGRLVPTEAELARAEGREYEPASELLKRILQERRRKWEEAGRQAKYEEPAAPDTSYLRELPEGWCWATGDQLFSFVTSGSRGWAKYYAASGALFLRIGNLDHNSIAIDLSSVQRVQPPPGLEGERTRVNAADILISITADVGMVGLVLEGLEEAFINQHIALARPAHPNTSPFIAWALASPEGQRSLRALQRGATKTGLGLDDIRAVPVPVPPLAEQRRIRECIDTHLSLSANLSSAGSSACTRATLLRHSLLRAAFEGTLLRPITGPGKTPNDAEDAGGDFRG